MKGLISQDYNVSIIGWTLLVLMACVISCQFLCKNSFLCLTQSVPIHNLWWKSNTIIKVPVKVINTMNV